jgi:DNA-binding response OmpR family regulator
LVEDEKHLAAGLTLNFRLEGFAVDAASTAREARHLLASAEYQAIVLDVMLPDLDGFELCRRMREAGNFTPVIMLTARHSAEDRVQGLEAGADDYIIKPFDLAELLARVRSVLRRRRWDQSAETSPEEVFRFGTNQVNFSTYQAAASGKLVALTKIEFDLLRYFSENPGRVISRAELLEQVWKLRNYPNTRTVDNFIVRLRKLFEPNPQQPVYFHSIRGAGYKFLPKG